MGVSISELLHLQSHTRKSHPQWVRCRGGGVCVDKACWHNGAPPSLTLCQFMSPESMYVPPFPPQEPQMTEIAPPVVLMRALLVHTMRAQTAMSMEVHRSHLLKGGAKGGSGISIPHTIPGPDSREKIDLREPENGTAKFHGSETCGHSTSCCARQGYNLVQLPNPALLCIPISWVLAGAKRGGGGGAGVCDQ